MKFTKSKDGIERASVRVVFRITTGEAAFALALAHYDISHQPDLAVASATKADVRRVVRDTCEAHGPPANWPDGADNDDFERVLESAKAVVAELWDDYEVPR